MGEHLTTTRMVTAVPVTDSTPATVGGSRSLLLPAVLLGHRLRGLPDDLLHSRDVLGVGHRHVDDGRGPALAVVADLQDLAVPDVPDDAAAVTQPGDAQPDRLDRADGAHAGVDEVADAVLVLEDEEDPGQEVLHERLGAEAQGDPDDARARDAAARSADRPRRGSSAERSS